MVQHLLVVSSPGTNRASQDMVESQHDLTPLASLGEVFNLIGIFRLRSKLGGLLPEIQVSSPRFSPLFFHSHFLHFVEF